MKRTNIYLEEEQTAVLGQLASNQGLSRAELIRRIINKALDDQSGSLASDMDAIRESFGVLRDSRLDVPLREEDDRQRHLQRIWDASE